MTPKDKITKAKIKLILKEPFFATLLLSIPIKEDKDTKTATTNGVEIRYNPEYIDTISVDQVTALLCHEVLHITNLHATRRAGRDQKLWNRACDYVINPILKECGFELPADVFIDRQFKDMHAEKVFSLLPSPTPQDEEQPGEVEDSPAKTEGEKQQQESEIKQKIIQAATVAKKSGTLTEGLKRLIEETLKPVINWKEILSRFVTDISRNDYSFKKPNPRFIQSGFYLPSLYTEEPGKIILLVDTSGSIDKNLLDQFGAEIQDVCAQIGHSLTVIYVDTKINAVEEIDPESPVKLQPIGGGGTDFRPGFEHIESEDLNPKAVIYFTDGECNRYPLEPAYPVLWAQYGECNFKPPFGEIVYFN